MQNQPNADGNGKFRHLGMNWLEFNHVYINCYNKLVRFLTPGEEEEVGFLSTRDPKELLEEEAQMFVLFSMLSAKSQPVVDELQVVQDFPKVFSGDISDILPERERYSFLLILSLVPDLFLCHHT